MHLRGRTDAGRRLARRIAELGLDDPVVVALPRGGVPVAAEIADALDAALDVLVVRKLGHPRQPELGVGAVGEGGVTLFNGPLMRQLGLSAADLEPVRAREQIELERRVARYRGDDPRAPVAGREVVLVDDGLATGFTARAGLDLLRRAGARTVVLAVPVAPADTVAELHGAADLVVCLHAPQHFRAIGDWYDDFTQVSDEEVTSALALRATTGGGARSRRDTGRGEHTAG